MLPVQNCRRLSNSAARGSTSAATHTDAAKVRSILTRRQTKNFDVAMGHEEGAIVWRQRHAGGEGVLVGNRGQSSILKRISFISN
jgi:hypothetical protein